MTDRGALPTPDRAPGARSVWIGLAIFVAAAALRVSLVETARFTGDESRDYAIDVDIAHGRAFPLLGPVLTGGQARLPGPLFHWLGAIPYLVCSQPEAGNLLFELLGALTVWMFWLSVRPAFGQGAATFAAALMAFSPWSALFGDRVWNPHAFLLCEGLALLAVVRLSERPGSKWAIVLPVACLALPQLHMSAPVVWLALVPLAASSWRRWNRRYLVVGLALGALLYIPFTVHEWETHFGNTRAFLSETFATKKPGRTNTSFLLTPIYVARFLTLDVTYHELSGYWGGLDERAAWHALWFGSPARPANPLRLAALLASLLLLALAIVAAGSHAWRSRRESGRSLGSFARAAAVAIVLDFAFLAATNKQIFAHYVSLTLPFAFVVYAQLWRSAVGGPRPTLRRGVLVALAVAFCLGGIEATRSISTRIDGRNGLAVHRAVSRRVLRDFAAAGSGADVAHLEIAYMANLSQYAIFSRYAAGGAIRWTGGEGGRFSYRLQKQEDSPPPQPQRFPSLHVGPVTLFRLR
jgi:dolichyl-phosphate-mannose-protein mannosyltransferase